MKKCSANCIPCCDFCVHCLHAYAADGGGRCEPLGCMLHRDYEHESIVEACGECDDFQCFRVPPSNADRFRAMSDEELAKIITSDLIGELIPFCQNKYECDAMLSINTIPEEWCMQCALDWLQQPEKEETMDYLKKYPFLKDEDPNTYMEQGESWIDCLPGGWHARFLEWCEDVVILFENFGASIKNFHINQVKEKFGSAIVYWHFDGTPPEESVLGDALQNLADVLEEDTGNMCHKCGAPAKFSSVGWVVPYCENCAIIANREANERHKSNFTIGQTFRPIKEEHHEAD